MRNSSLFVVEGPAQPFAPAPAAQPRGGAVFGALAKHDRDAGEPAHLRRHLHLPGHRAAQPLVLLGRQIALSIREDQAAHETFEEGEVLVGVGQTAQRRETGRAAGSQHEVGTPRRADHHGQAMILVHDHDPRVGAAQREQTDAAQQRGLARARRADQQTVAQILGGDLRRALNMEMKRVFGVRRRAQHDDRRAPAAVIMAARHVVMGRHRHGVDAFDRSRPGPPAPVARDLAVKGRLDRRRLARAGDAGIGDQAQNDGHAPVQFFERWRADDDRELVRDINAPPAHHVVFVLGQFQHLASARHRCRIASV